MPAFASMTRRSGAIPVLVAIRLRLAWSAGSSPAGRLPACESGPSSCGSSRPPCLPLDAHRRPCVARLPARRSVRPARGRRGRVPIPLPSPASPGRRSRAAHRAFAALVWLGLGRCWSSCRSIGRRADPAAGARPADAAAVARGRLPVAPRAARDEPVQRPRHRPAAARRDGSTPAPARPRDAHRHRGDGGGRGRLHVGRRSPTNWRFAISRRRRPASDRPTRRSSRRLCDVPASLGPRPRGRHPARPATSTGGRMAPSTSAASGAATTSAGSPTSRRPARSDSSAPPASADTPGGSPRRRLADRPDLDRGRVLDAAVLRVAHRGGLRARPPRTTASRSSRAPGLATAGLPSMAPRSARPSPRSAISSATCDRPLARELDYWVFADGQLGRRVRASVSGHAHGIVEGGLQGDAPGDDDRDRARPAHPVVPTDP